MSKLGLEFIDSTQFQLGVCKFDSSLRDLLFDNPHCIEYFCVLDNCSNCSKCYHLLKEKYSNYYDKMENGIEMTEEDKNILLQLVTIDEKECKDVCFVKNSIIYGIRRLSHEPLTTTHNIDKIKGIANKSNFFRKEIIECVYDAKTILDKLDPKKIINYESTFPKNKTVIKWGQLKLFLETLYSMIKVLNGEEQVVHVIYCGSAPGTSLVQLCSMLPCLRLYLIDPRQQAPGLKGHPQVMEIKNQYFTDDTAKYYSKKMKIPKQNKEKVIFMSDIRIATDDTSIVRDNTIQANWHNIIKPDWSFLKFRCPYNAPNNKIMYFDAKYYFQPYAPLASTETRVFVPTNCEMKEIDIMEYQRICLFHNRVLRPSCYEEGINYKYFDKCYDCSFFKKIITDYNKLYPEYFKNKKITLINKMMEYVCCNFERTDNQLEKFTNSLKSNLR